MCDVLEVMRTETSSHTPPLHLREKSLRCILEHQSARKTFREFRAVATDKSHNRFVVYVRTGGSLVVSGVLSPRVRR